MPIVNNAVNDCAMCVLADSPVDPATGLPVPTVAVATSGGVSVIKHDGSVANITATDGFNNVAAIMLNGSELAFEAMADFDGSVDNVTFRLAEPDRSVKGNGLIVNGTLTRAPVASGASLCALSGFSAANYLEAPYSANMDFGTGDFYVMGWLITTGAAANQWLVRRNLADGASNAGRFAVTYDSSGKIALTTDATAIASATAVAANQPTFFVVMRSAGVGSVWLNGAQDASAANAVNLTLANATLGIGAHAGANPATTCKLALLRIGATAPTADQIAHIYRTELPLFQPNAKCVIDGTSSAVTALAHDPDANLLHVGTSWGRNAFVADGLLLVASNATTSGAITSISAGQGAHVTGGASSARYAQAALILRDEIVRQAEAKRAQGYRPQTFDFDATASQSVFTLPAGWTAREVLVAGASKREGSTKDWTRSFDGFRESVVLAVGQSASTWVQIIAVRSN